MQLNCKSLGIYYNFLFSSQWLEIMIFSISKGKNATLSPPFLNASKPGIITGENSAWTAEPFETAFYHEVLLVTSQYPNLPIAEATALRLLIDSYR